MANSPFRNVSKAGEPLISDNLEANLVSYFNWNILGTSAFMNVSYPASGAWGGSAARMRLAKHPNYTDGRVWEGFRKQWIWQSGVNADVQPISISGVKVNGTFYPSSTSGTYAHKIDYPNGRIIFANAISTSATVLVEHSFSHYQFYTADSPWWQNIQKNSYRIDDATFHLNASGIWSVPPEQRVQLPCVVIEATPNVRKRPFEIGSHHHWHNQEIRAHIITETRQDMKWIVDVLGGQYGTVINLFSKASMVASGVYPINMVDGSLSSNVGNYPDFVANYPAHRELEFKDTRAFDNNQYIIDIQDKRTIPYYFTTVRFDVETLLN